MLFTKEKHIYTGLALLSALLLRAASRYAKVGNSIQQSGMHTELGLAARADALTDYSTEIWY